MSVSGVRNANFSDDFSYVLNEWSLSDLFMLLRLNWGRLFKVNNAKKIVTTEEKFSNVLSDHKEVFQSDLRTLMGAETKLDVDMHCKPGFGTIRPKPCS